MPTLKIAPNTPLHKKILERISSRMKMARSEQMKQHQRWRDAENRMVAWVPESTVDAKRRTRRDDRGEPQYTTIQIPYTYAVVMTAHTYWTSVLLSRSPVFQFSGENGTGEMQVQAMEALVQHQVSAGRLLAPYYLWLYDAAKYGVGIVGTYWDKRVKQYGMLMPDASGAMTQVSLQVPGYQGNCIYNVSPYDFFPDPRVTVGNFQKGEFLGVEIPMAWHEVKACEARGDYMNVDKISARSGEWRGQGDRENSSSQVIRPDDSLWALAGNGEDKHPARVRVLEFHCEISPQEWGVGNAKSSEKWVFTLTADEKLLLGATPLGALHAEFPFGVIESEMEAYGVWNRGLPELVNPLQQTMDWLLNTHFYNVRAALNNQFLMDPSRVYVKDAEKGGPGFIFRARPEGYGTDLRTALVQFPVNDVTQAHLNDVQTMLGFGEKMLGINEQMFGGIIEGGRKTATEIRTSTGFGTNRQKTQTEWLACSGFMPHAHQITANTLQYYDGAQKVRIVGDAAVAAGAQFIMATPESIAGEYDLVPVDGSAPIDRFAQVNMFKDLLGTIMQSPMGMQVLAGFDMTKMFGWMFSLGGLKNLGQFRAQVLPPGAEPGMGMGGENVIPFNPGAGGGPQMSPSAGGDMNGGMPGPEQMVGAR